ncbi:TPR end-of-group domain-containing protein [Candidatus Uabimicrobium amorphum]|uniref:Intracellular proteinase inhibitor BsuPI domain-containing protein n=1 Tax=Uabimicrobium amorphum TaxID=2596890 RepID=A0A5S9F3S2_UABAM|nr:BsuPI-related putative proteinase inhibitor [Candidatus Uabimicrobium amorphum]BBM83829.1 hypothetical protein UABAM_02184 [Candidatus Uabimicrobium amorphum]
MFKKITLFVLFSCIALFADNNVKDQIESLLKERENLLKERDLSSKAQMRHSSHPQGLEKIQTWTHLGAAVSEITLQETADIKVRVYVCAPYKRYWYRLQGSILNVDLWYGYYQYSYGNNDRSFFKTQFRNNHAQQVPSLHPRQLQFSVQYRTTDYGNIVTKYSHGPIFPGYNAFSYYCNRGNRYWVELVEIRTQRSYWYGPYNYYTPTPATKLKVVVELDKPQYEINESPNVKIWVFNNSSRAVWLKFSRGLRGDYMMDNRYTWSKGRVFTQVLGRELVPAYGKVQLFHQYHPIQEYPLAPGQHSIVGIVQTRNYGILRSKSITFSVRRPAIPPHNSPSTGALMQKAINLMKKGKYNIARKILQKIIQTEPNSIIGHYNLACVEAITYNEDLALDYLARAFELGYRDFAHVRQDPDLNNIRHLRRFRRLIKKYQYK